MIIPDKLLIVGAVFAIAFNYLAKITEPNDMVLGSVILGGGTWFLVFLIESVTKKEVMGGGDIKLFGMLGLFLGLKGGLLSLGISIYIGALYGIVIIIYSKIRRTNYNSMIPYGPFIAMATIIYIIISL